jgi:hypothetical protein
VTTCSQPSSSSCPPWMSACDPWRTSCTSSTRCRQRCLRWRSPRVTGLPNRTRFRWPSSGSIWRRHFSPPTGVTAAQHHGIRHKAIPNTPVAAGTETTMMPQAMISSPRRTNWSSPSTTAPTTLFPGLTDANATFMCGAHRSRNASRWQLATFSTTLSYGFTDWSSMAAGQRGSSLSNWSTPGLGRH